MTETRDPFFILNVAEDADEAAIRAAYRIAAMEAHPDRVGGSVAKFQDVSWAFECLNDPIRRAEAVQRRGAKQAPPVVTAFDSFFDNVDRYGRRTVVKAPTRQRSKSGNFELVVSLEEAFRGGKFLLKREGGRCHRCAGLGTVKVKEHHACAVCGGMGFSRAGRGFITVKVECSACDATGLSNIIDCPDCGGTGGGEGLSVQVEIPEGCRDGYQLSLAHVPDVQITVKVASHPVFKREIEHLAAELTIPVWDAALGAEVPFAGIDGTELAIVVPAGTRHGDRIDVPGAGMPAFSGRGSLRLTVKVASPDANGPMRDLLLEMRRRALSA